ncbi:hypothetical protein R4Y45_01480 [Holzapfeliella sp. He02]|uniref:Uncharacterized protein n=1 Tax=Holzapfeliella saturejae TaxID=3082953 RepID=A0ABU8SEU5_9LACO
MRYQAVVNNLATKDYSWNKIDKKAKQIREIINFNNDEGNNIKEIYSTENIDRLGRRNLALICRASSSQHNDEYGEMIDNIPIYILIFIVDYKDTVAVTEDSFYKISDRDLEKSRVQDSYTYTHNITLRDLFFKAKEKVMKIDTLLDSFLED